MRGRVKMKAVVCAFSRKFIVAFRKYLLMKMTNIFANIKNAKTERPFHVLYYTAADPMLSFAR
jgi:hypothetical protein